MSITPVVDLIVPVYNVEDWLGACLESIAEQTLTEWRALIILDGSTDGSAEIARSFAARDPRFEIHSYENAGLGAARNRGIELASAAFVMFIDSDDVLPPSALHRLVSTAQADESEIVTGFANQSESMATFWPYWTMRTRPAPTLGSTTDLRRSPLLILDHTAWNKLYSLDFLRATGHQYPVGTTCEDVVPAIQSYISAKRVSVIDDVVYIHRRRPGSITTSGHHGSRALRDWSHQTHRAASLVDEFGDERVATAYYRRMLESEAWTRASKWVELPDDDREILRETLMRLFESAQGAHAHLRPDQLATYRLIQNDDQESARLLGSGVSAPPTPSTLQAISRLSSVLSDSAEQDIVDRAWSTAVFEPIIASDRMLLDPTVRAAMHAESVHDLIRRHPLAIAVRDATTSTAPIDAAIVARRHTVRGSVSFFGQLHLSHTSQTRVEDAYLLRLEDGEELSLRRTRSGNEFARRIRTADGGCTYAVMVRIPVTGGATSVALTVSDGASIRSSRYGRAHFRAVGDWRLKLEMRESVLRRIARRVRNGVAGRSGSARR